MTDYTKLVQALRCCIPNPPETCEGCTYNTGGECNVNGMMSDAADAIERLVSLYEKAEMDATNLTGKLAQAEADVERLNMEIDKRIATEIELSNQVDALQAENPIVETVLLDKMRQQMEENVCHCNVKENAELIAKILDDDVDRKVFELPKRGKWVRVEDEESYHYECSRCCERPLYSRYGDVVLSGVCPMCGAEMEAQE